MSTLLVDQLFNGTVFAQKIKVKRDVSVAHIRPWIFLPGILADGQFQCEVFQGATLLATSQIDYTDINAVKTETYAHGFIRFDFDSLILRLAEGESETEYIFKFSMQNHTTDTVNYLGIVREWDAKSAVLYGDVDTGNQATNDSIEPCGYQIYEYRSL